MNIKSNIPLFKVHMPDTVNTDLLQTLHSGFIGQGPKVDEFENKLGHYIGNENVLSLNSGTSGLHLALRLSDVGYGDEVISTSMTCTASNMPILACGAKIVWADVDPLTGLISPESIKSKITKKTKAIVMVHFGGIPCDIEEINSIAKEHGIKTIEDGAHAFGASYNNEMIGNHSDFVMFSFQAIKHITTIDGGALFCKNKSDYERGKLLRWYGIDRESPRKDFRCEENIIEYGYKFHMNDICALIGTEQLKYAEKIVSAHENNAEFYSNNIANSLVKKITYEDNKRSSYWLYTIHVKNRDTFMKYLDEHNIMSSKVHERNDKHDAFIDSRVELPGVDKFCDTQVSIPVGWWLSESEREYIVNVVNSYSS